MHRLVLYTILFAGIGIAAPATPAHGQATGGAHLFRPRNQNAVTGGERLSSATVTSEGADSGKTDAFLKQLIRSNASPALQRVLSRPDSFRYQLIYTRIDRDRDNHPHFHHYYYRVNPFEYFNPASTVKLPLALLALEKMDSLARYGIDKFTPLLVDSAYSGQTIAHSDSSAASGLPSLAQYIKKIFLVSDNDAYNRLYEFLGQQPLNERLHQLGYPRIRITRQFMPLNEEENRHTNPIRFIQAPTEQGGIAKGSESDGTVKERNQDPLAADPGRAARILYSQPAAVSHFSFDYSRPVFLGNAYMDRHDSLVREPMDFTRHNNIPLEDLQQLLQSVLFPESVPASRRFHLRPEDYRFLYRFMSQFPRETAHPRYDTTEYFDSYTKFFLFKAGHTPIPPYIRVFNKPGWSYGFLTDVAYVADFKNKVEFMLSGVIYVNSDGVLNDDKYDYEEIGYPFFKEVGDIIYRYELQRTRKYPPDLKKFIMSYGPADF